MIQVKFEKIGFLKETQRLFAINLRFIHVNTQDIYNQNVKSSCFQYQQLFPAFQNALEGLRTQLCLLQKSNKFSIKNYRNNQIAIVLLYFMQEHAEKLIQEEETINIKSKIYQYPQSQFNFTVYYELIKNAQVKDLEVEVLLYEQYLIQVQTQKQLARSQQEDNSFEEEDDNQGYDQIYNVNTSISEIES